LKPVGILEVKLVQAKELTNKDIIGKSDPYALVYIRPLRDRMKKSKTIVSLILFPFVPVSLSQAFIGPQLLMTNFVFSPRTTI
jgi:hypothetical protein